MEMMNRMSNEYSLNPVADICNKCIEIMGSDEFVWNETYSEYSSPHLSYYHMIRRHVLIYKDELTHKFIVGDDDTYIFYEIIVPSGEYITIMDTAYKYVSTEEEFFQHSLMYDVGNLTFVDYKKMLDMIDLVKIKHHESLNK